MGFEVRLQDELGDRLYAVADPKNILDRLFPEPGNREDLKRGSLDPYAVPRFVHRRLRMGLCIVLTDEDGNNLELVTDDRNLLHELLPPQDDDSNPMLA